MSKTFKDPRADKEIPKKKSRNDYREERHRLRQFLDDVVGPLQNLDMYESLEEYYEEMLNVEDLEELF